MVKCEQSLLIFYLFITIANPRASSCGIIIAQNNNYKEKKKKKITKQKVSGDENNFFFFKHLSNSRGAQKKEDNLSGRQPLWKRA